MTDLATWSRAALRDVSAAHRRRNRSQGSLINLSDYPDFAAIIGHPALAALFDSLDFGDPVFSSGYRPDLGVRPRRHILNQLSCLFGNLCFVEKRNVDKRIAISRISVRW